MRVRRNLGGVWEGIRNWEVERIEEWKVESKLERKEKNVEIGNKSGE